MNIFKEPAFPLHLEEDLKGLGFSFSADCPGDIYYPSGKGASARLLSHIRQHNFKYYSQIPGTEFICTKDQLWISVVLNSGREKALEIFPDTVILKIENDRKRVSTDLYKNENDNIILKKNAHNRKGLEVICGHEWKAFAGVEEYVIAQPVLTTLKVFTKRPFHFRSYCILTYNNNKLELWLCPNAKIIYGEQESVITRNGVEVETHLPLFLDELNLHSHGVNPDLLLAELSKKMECIIEAVLNKIKQQPLTGIEYCAQLFGTDFIVTEQKELKIIEVNGRPELKGTNAKDIILKKAIVHDLFMHFLIKAEIPEIEWKLIGNWDLTGIKRVE